MQLARFLPLAATLCACYATPASSRVHMHLRIHQKQENPKTPEQWNETPSPSATVRSDPPIIQYDDEWAKKTLEGGQVIGPFGQCGGESYRGPTQCIKGIFTCVFVSDEYSQCQPAPPDTWLHDDEMEPMPTAPGDWTEPPQTPSSTWLEVFSNLVSNSAVSPTNGTSSQAEGSDEQDQERIVPPWLQCGGSTLDVSGANGDHLPCADAFQCTELNEWFWQCLPPHEKDKVSYWSQCGGQDHQGLTDCAEGSICVAFNDWYSECIPDDE